MSVSIDQAKALLASRELAEVEVPVAEAIGLSILPAEFATPYQNQLNRAEISSDQAVKLLTENRDELKAFYLGIQEATKDDDPDGEFPPGYDPDDEESSDEEVVLGIGSGFGLTQLCLWKFASAGDRSGLQA